MPSEYATRGLPPAPAVSMQTMHMVGFLVDVYGLDELPASGPVTCLWLLHPRTRDRSIMKDIASRAVAAWNASPEGQRRQRGLVALAADMPNHGTRLVQDMANQDWLKGNKTHAIDMVGIVQGGVTNTASLMDLASGYLQRQVDAHISLGWSLGGHMAWQQWIGEDRIDASVSIVGCPDMMGLLSSRAAYSNINYDPNTFLGSTNFPSDVVNNCLAHDPKGILFGVKAVPQAPLSKQDQDRLRPILESRVHGKRLLLCFGSEDKLVPPANSMPLLAVLKDAATGWYDGGKGGITVIDKVYDGVGHAFSKDMVTDSVEFIVDAVARGPRTTQHKAKI